MSKDFREKRTMMVYDLSERKARTWTIEEAIQVFTDSDTLGHAKDRILAMYLDLHTTMDYDTLEAAYALAFDSPRRSNAQ
jgi:hypothetical protein